MYVYYLPKDLYGYWLASGYFLVLITAVDPGLTIVVQQKVAMAYSKSDFEYLIRVISAAIILAFFIGCVIVLFGSILIKYVPSVLDIENSILVKNLNENLFIAVLGTGLSIFSFTIASINTGLLSSMAVNLITLLINLTSSFISGIMLKHGYGLYSITVPLLFSGFSFLAAQSLYLFLRLYSEGIKFNLKLSGVNELIGQLSITSIGRFMSLIASNVDLLLIAKLVSPITLVAYSITKKAFDYSKEILNLIVVSVSPSFTNLYADGDFIKVRKVFLLITRLIITLLTMVSGALTLYNECFINNWTNNTNYLGDSTNILLVFSLVIVLFYNMLQIFVTSFGLFKVYSHANFILTILQLLFIYFLTRLFGLNGSVIASCLAILVYPFFIYCKNLLHEMKINLMSLWKDYFDLVPLFPFVALYYYFFKPVELLEWKILFLEVICYLIAFISFTLIISQRLRGELLFFLKLVINKKLI